MRSEKHQLYWQLKSHWLILIGNKLFPIESVDWWEKETTYFVHYNAEMSRVLMVAVIFYKDEKHEKNIIHLVSINLYITKAV